MIYLIKNTRRVLIFLIILSTYFSSLGQGWKNIKNTKIYFSNLIDSNYTNSKSYTFEYFKRNDTLIAIHKDFAKDIYSLFEKSPNAFSSLFNAAFYKSNNDFNYYPYYVDSTINNTSFNKIVAFEKKDIQYGFDEEIWSLRNVCLTVLNKDPCYTNIVFSKKYDKKTKKNKLKYKISFFLICEI